MGLCQRHLSFVYVTSLLVDSTFLNSNLILNPRAAGLLAGILLCAFLKAYHPYQVVGSGFYLL